jgi:hypothetical protein
VLRNEALAVLVLALALADPDREAEWEAAPELACWEAAVPVAVAVAADEAAAVVWTTYVSQPTLIFWWIYLTEAAA